MSEAINILTGLSTEELSIVRNGANRRRIAITKKGTAMDQEIVGALASTPAEGEEALAKSMDGKDQKSIDAATVNFRLLKGLRDLVDDESMTAVLKAAGYTQPKADPKQDPKGPVKKSVDLSGLDPEARARIEAVFKSNEELTKKSEQLEAVIKAAEDARLSREYLEKATASYAHLGEVKEIADVVKNLHGVDEKLAERVEKIFADSEARIAKGNLFREIGSSHAALNADAHQRGMAMVNDIITKSGGKTTEAEAWSTVLEAEPALYEEYLAQKAGA